MAVAAFEHRNLTLAAAELGMTQPAVSFHLRRFEALYGFNLLTRSGNSFMPTNEGLEALYHCRQILAAHDAIASIETRRTLKILLSPDFMAILLNSGELTGLADHFHCVTARPDYPQRAFDSCELALFVRYMSPNEAPARWSFKTS